MENKLFSFKQKSQDFIVEEELPFQLSGKWDVFFVFFEKRNLNTMDIVNHICATCNISRLTLGIAWLKDKKAITKQRICIYKSALKKLGGEKVFLETISQKAKVINVDWNNEPIWMTTPIKNIFHIRLRANKNLSQQEKDLTKKKIISLCDKWFANFFWSQRFGINWINPKQWKNILDWTLKLKDHKERMFKIQAYASKLYNEYVNSRTKKWLECLDWDIIQIMNEKKNTNKQLWIYKMENDSVQIFENDLKDKDFFRYPKILWKEIPFDDKKMMITWPVVGYNLILAPEWTEAWKREKSFLQWNWLSAKSLRLCMDYKIFGIRRPLRVFPEKVNVAYQKDDVLLKFWLPSWSYASILINELWKTIWVDVDFEE